MYATFLEETAMSIEILGQVVDIRTETNVIYAKTNIDTYLKIVGNDFDSFNIQRKRVQHKGYNRMRQDILDGTLLPSITLSVKQNFIDEILASLDDNKRLKELLSIPDQVHILDGLQRTHILHDIRSSGIEFKENHCVLLEFWLEKSIQNLIYRIIVLNAGQKPMSMRHQIELLFSTTGDQLIEEIHDLEIITERDEARRSKARKYPLDRLATSYYAFTSKSTEIEKENLIAQQLMEEDILAGGEEKLGHDFSAFKDLLKKFVVIDDEVCRLYESRGCAWIGSENVMISFFATVADFSSNESKKERAISAIEKLIEVLKASNSGEDPIGLNNYEDTILGFNPRKANVGYTTRKYLSSVFREFFREEGDKSIAALWVSEAP